MRHKMLFTILTVALSALLFSPLVAQQTTTCGPRAAVLERLSVGYGETRRSIGLGGDNALMEVFASDRSGTWTITVTLASGLTCLIAAGQAFETATEVASKPGEGA